MFGTLRPHRCGLGAPERDAYDGFYCGLCKSLGDGFGQASRALVSHDAVFLAMLVDGLSEAPGKPDRCRCPLLPIVHRPTVEPGGVAMRFASAVEILLGDQYLADRALEGKRLAKLARPFARRYVERATERLADIGLDFSALEGFESRQAACEELGRTSPADAARPTAEALAFVLATIARLPGVREEARGAEATAALARLGAALGGIIYLADALDDLKQDFERGDFNPCVGHVRGALVIDERRIDDAVALLRRALADAREALAALPLARNRALLESVIDERLPRAARDATRAAKLAAQADNNTAALPWGRRLLHHVAVFAAFVLAWLFGGGSASAQPADKPRAKAKPSASASAAASDSAPIPEPPLPIAPTPSSPTPEATADPEPEKDPQTGKPLEPTSEGEGDGKTTPPCSGCAECGKGCDSCCKGCGDFFGKCPCGEACKSCGVCDCCNGCKGGNPCDGCCKGCSDPCKGCCDGCGGGGGNCCGAGGKCC
ncbi:MAG: heterocycloanthracin/sonorensin family bacteriocin [Myxococcales bacterium]|nr:heterocycloanthracin/sonorensin family bacteriocin [Myxococcales bacterium]